MYIYVHKRKLYMRVSYHILNKTFVSMQGSGYTIPVPLKINI